MSIKEIQIKKLGFYQAIDADKLNNDVISIIEKINECYTLVNKINFVKIDRSNLEIQDNIFIRQIFFNWFKSIANIDENSFNSLYNNYE